MLTLIHQNAEVPRIPLPSFAASLAEPFPQTPQDMLERIFPPDFGQRRTISEGYLHACFMM